MKIFILISNILVPFIMIFIGILYKKSSYKKINTILALFIPIAMTGSGFSHKTMDNSSKNLSLLEASNKKCSVIWTLSGLFTLIITFIVLILNNSNIINAISFSDAHNVSVIMLEVELAVSVIVFISVEYILKKSFYKQIKTLS